MKMLKRWISVCLVILLLAGVAFDHSSLIGSTVEAAGLEETDGVEPAEESIAPATYTDAEITSPEEQTPENTEPAEQTVTNTDEETEVPKETPSESTESEEQTVTNTDEETKEPVEQPETSTNTETQESAEETETNTDPETPAPQAAGNEAAVDSLDNANGL